MATIKRHIIYNMGHFVWLCWINREGILWCYLHIVAPHGLYPGERRILIDQKLSAVSGRNIYIGCMIIEYDRYTYIFGKEFWNPLEPPNFTMGGIPSISMGGLWLCSTVDRGKPARLLYHFWPGPDFRTAPWLGTSPIIYGLKMAYKHRTNFGGSSRPCLMTGVHGFM